MDGFLTVPNTIIAPVDRTTASNILPAAIKPAAVVNNWVSFSPQFINRWAETLVAGVSTARDGSKSTPGFSIGDATVEAAYLRDGSNVILRLWIKLGTASLINSLVWDYATSKMSGNRGNTSMVLPFRVAPGNSYQFSLLNFLPSQSAYAQLTPLAPKATEMPVDVWDRLAHSTTGTPAAPFASLWAAGNPYDLQLEYETDAA